MTPASFFRDLRGDLFVRVGSGDPIKLASNPEDSLLKGLLLCEDDAEQIIRRGFNRRPGYKHLKQLGVRRYLSPKELLDLVFKLAHLLNLYLRQSGGKRCRVCPRERAGQLGEDG